MVSQVLSMVTRQNLLLIFSQFIRFIFNNITYLYSLSKKPMKANKRDFLIFMVFFVFLFSFAESISPSSVNIHDEGIKNYHLRTQDLHLRSSRSGGLGVFGFIIGPVLFIISFIMTWNNQKKSAIDIRRLNLANGLVKQVNPFKDEQIAENNGNLVHITGRTNTGQHITDPLAGISLNNTVKLERNVQVKEFRSRTKRQDDRDVVQYDLLWVTQNQPQAYDRHNDHSNWFIQSEVIKARQVTIGNCYLNQSQIDRLQATQDYKLDMNNAQNILQRTGRRINQPPQIIGDYIYFPAQGGIESHGALRVYFKSCPVGPTSLIAKSNRNTFEPFRIDEYENGVRDDVGDSTLNCGACFLSSCVQKCFDPITEIDFIKQEGISYELMIQEELKLNTCRTWGFRIGTFILMVLGIVIFFSPITSLLGYIPLFGGILQGVVGIAVFIAALLVSIPLWLLTFSIAWMVYHPKVGIIFLVITLAIIGLIVGLTISKSGGKHQEGLLDFGMRKFI